MSLVNWCAQWARIKGRGSPAQCPRKEAQAGRSARAEVFETFETFEFTATRACTGLHGPTPQLLCFICFKCLKGMVTLLLRTAFHAEMHGYKRFFISHYELLIMSVYSLRASSSVNQFTEIFTEQDCVPVNVLVSWDATDSCSCQ